MLRRDQHSQIGLAAGTWERGGDVFFLTVWRFHAQNQHMLRHPALALTQHRADTQGKAFLAEQDVAAVSGVDAPDGVFLRELRDIFLFGVDFCLGMQAFDEVRALVELFDHRITDARHNVHGKHDIDGVGDFDADFGERTADHAHGIRDHVHRATLHGAVEQLPHFGIHFVLLYPIVGRTGILLLSRTDDGSLFVSGDVLRIGAVIVAARKLLFVELDHFSGLYRKRADRVQLRFTAVNPDDFLRFGHGGAFCDPIGYFFVLNLDHCSLPLLDHDYNVVLSF